MLERLRGRYIEFWTYWIQLFKLLLEIEMPEVKSNRSVKNGSMPIILVSLAAAHSVLPGVLNTFFYGNKGLVAIGPLTGLSATLIAVLFALSIFWKLLLLNNFQLLQLNLRPLGFSLLPWGAYLVSTAINQDPIGIQLFLFPLLMVYFASHGVNVLFLRSVAIATMTIGLITAAYTLRYPEFAIFTADKNVYLIQTFLPNGGLVTGGYSHPNLLASIMCLGTAFSFYLSREFRVICNVSFGLIILFTGSRTSLICFLLIIFLNSSISNSRRFTRTLLRGTLIVSGLSIIVVPLFQSSISSFSGRSGIWKSSMQLWATHPMFGGGPMTYLNLRRVFNDLGEYAFNGHNLFINTVTTLGIVGFLSFTIFISYNIKKLWKIEIHDRPIAVWLITFLALSILEVRFEIANLSQVGFVSWFAFGYILFRNPTQRIFIRPQ